MHFPWPVKPFMSEKSNVQIQSALRVKSRNFTSQIFQDGDSVYYIRGGKPAWKGSGCVIGVEEQTMMVKH